MPAPRAPWKIALFVGVALAAGGLAVGAALLLDAPPAGQPPADEPGAPHEGMPADERCAHMPEHCEGDAAG